ncbi:uncharacterized protein [Leptinotarsa decemlineata]|uniref:uncharacterized protein n=1 Tax=Leptinotarsa decemlineata TaxID=7539 RepID=UPI003D30C76C
MHYSFFFSFYSAMDRNPCLRKCLTEKELQKLAENFYESEDDLQDLEEENFPENIEDCINLASQKFQNPVDFSDLDIENIPIIFDHELDEVDAINLETICDNQSDPITQNTVCDNDSDPIDQNFPEHESLFTFDKKAFKSMSWKEASFEENSECTKFGGDDILPKNMELSTPYQFFRYFFPTIYFKRLQMNRISTAFKKIFPNLQISRQMI